MTALSRPSHFMLIFLLTVGAALLFASEWVVPQPAKKSNGSSSGKAVGRVISPGVIEPGARRKDAANEQAAKSADLRVASSGTVKSGTVKSGAEKGASALPILWTLRGAVFGEKLDASPGAARPSNDSSPLAVNFPVDLELIPLDANPAAGRLLRHTSGSDGRFLWEGLFPGNYRLRAMPEPAASELLPVAVDVKLPDIPRAYAEGSEKKPIFRQEITLPRPRTLIGSIRIKEGGAFPEDEFAGLRISVSELGIARGQAVANTDGRFEIRGVGHGPYDFRIQDSKGRDVRWEIGQWAPTEADPETPSAASPAKQNAIASAKSVDRGRVRVAIVLP